jgi:hypothetical protein
MASHLDDVDVARLPIKKGATVDAAHKTEDTPLIIACGQGHLRATQLLLDSVARANHARKDGVSPLIMACQEGHLPVVQLLLSRSANIHQAANDGVTALHMACNVSTLGSTSTCNASVAGLRSIMHQTKVAPRSSISCFVTAASSPHAHEGAVRLLLAAGASTTLGHSQGRSTMDWATEPRHVALRQILQQYMDAGAPCTQLAALQPSG